MELDRERHPDRTGRTHEINKEEIREGEPLRAAKKDAGGAAVKLRGFKIDEQC